MRPLLHEAVFQPAKERRARSLQLLLQLGGAVAAVAGPWLGAILVAAFATLVGVLYAGEIEILFPVWAFFLERCWAIADFDPACSLIFAETRVIHVAQIFAFGDRAFAELSTFDSAEQIGFTAGFYAGSDQISHSRLDVAHFCLVSLAQAKIERDRCQRAFG
jgi:hypothetical protein